MAGSGALPQTLGLIVDNIGATYDGPTSGAFTAPAGCWVSSDASWPSISVGDTGTLSGSCNVQAPTGLAQFTGTLTGSLASDGSFTLTVSDEMIALPPKSATFGGKAVTGKMKLDVQMTAKGQLSASGHAFGDATFETACSVLETSDGYAGCGPDAAHFSASGASKGTSVFQLGVLH